MSNARFGLRTRTGQISDIILQNPFVNYLLDDYTNAAAAYSLRLLRAGYAGSAIRVRRSNDNAEQDIGFALSNNLDTSALTTFVGANNGFVVTWYDQSGNGYNLTQSTAGNQPQIVSSGSVFLENNKPSIDFQSKLLARTNINILNNISSYSIFAIARGTSSAVSDKIMYQIVFTGLTMSKANLSYGPLTSLRYRFGGRRVSADSFEGIESNTNISTQGLITSIINHTDADATLYQNGTQVAQSLSFQVSGSTSNVNSDFNMGAIPNVQNPFAGNIQEFVLYEVDQSTNRTGIESNINTYYAIY
jgi:hypothetical protein